MPSSRNSGPSTSKPKRSYQARRGVWAFITTGRSGHAVSAVSSNGSARPRPRAPRASTTRPIRHSLPVVEDPGVADNRALVLHDHVPGALLLVAAVEVRVGTRLLHHEHVLSQAPDVVRRAGVEGGEGQGDDPHREELQRLPPRAASLRDERQHREDVDQVGHLDVGQLPTSLGGEAGEQPAARHERVPGAAEHQRGRQTGEVAQCRADLGPRQVVDRAGPPLGVGMQLAQEQPRVTRRHLGGLGRARGQVDPGRVQQQVGRLGRAPVPQRLRQRQGVAAAGGVASEHHPAWLGGPAPRQVGHRAERVPPRVLRREWVVRHNNPGLQSPREPRDVPDVEGVDRRHVPAAVHVEDGPDRVDVTRADHVRREADVLLDDREVMGEPGTSRVGSDRSSPACQRSIRARSRSASSRSRDLRSLGTAQARRS